MNFYNIYFHVLQAEARLAARRQARYEARNIRLKEIEKKQKEEDENQANHTNHNHVQHPGKTNKIKVTRDHPVE